jgi:hypothetical protein
MNNRFATFRTCVPAPTHVRTQYQGSGLKSKRSQEIEELVISLCEGFVGPDCFGIVGRVIARIDAHIVAVQQAFCCASSFTMISLFLQVAIVYELTLSPRAHFQDQPCP